MSGFTVVYCDLSDCFYYSPEPDFPRKCRCQHPDKRTVMEMAKCPLYRLDWQKRSALLSPSKDQKVSPKFEVEGHIAPAAQSHSSKKKPHKKYGAEDEED